MKKCKNCTDIEVCDFCFNYRFNPNKNGAYLGLGYCIKHKIHLDPEEGEDCEDFNCNLRTINKIRNFFINWLAT